MVQRIYKPSRTPLAMPGTPAMPNIEGLLSKVSTTLSKAADEQTREWQAAVQREASEQGSLAGVQGAPEYREGNSIRAEAYNTAAKKSYLSKLEIDTAATMQKLSEDFKNDPQAFMEASNEYIEGVTEELKSSSETVATAELFKARMQLDAQSTSYKIQKRYASMQQEKLQADNEDLFMTLKNNIYREAGGVFSRDPEVQTNTLERLAIGKKALDQTLHQVLPDGTPVYSPSEVTARENDFYRRFYTRAAQDYITNGDISEEELAQIMDGTFSAKIEGLGEINILDNVGADRYENDVKRFAMNKVRQQVAAEEKAERQMEESMKEFAKQNGVDVLDQVLSGAQVDADAVVDAVRNGQLNPSDGKAVLKLIHDPNAGTEDFEYVTHLQTQIIQGEDVEAEIKKNAYRMQPKTYQKLMTENAKAQTGQLDSYKKQLTDQALKKDQFGFVVPNSRKQAFDITTMYDQMIEDGMEPELAYERALQTLEAVRQDTFGSQYKRVPRYTVTAEGGTVDVDASFEATSKAFQEGRISLNEFEIEMDKLEAIQKGDTDE